MTELEQFEQRIDAPESLGPNDRSNLIVQEFLSTLGTFKLISETIGEGDSKIADARNVPLPDVGFDARGQLSSSTRDEFEKVQRACFDVLSRSRHLDAYIALVLVRGMLAGMTGLTEAVRTLAKAVENCWEQFEPPLRSDRIESPGIDRYKRLQVLARKRIKTTFFNRMPLVVLPDGRCLSVEMHKIAYNNHDYFAKNQLRRVDSSTGEVVLSKAESSLCNTAYVDDLMSSAGEELVKSWIEATQEAHATVGGQGTLAQRFVEMCNDSSAALGGSGKKTSALIFRELEQFIEEAQALFKDVLANSDFAPAQPENTEGSIEETESASDAEIGSEASIPTVNQSVTGSTKPASVNTQDDAVVLVDSALMYLLDHERSNPAIIFLVYARQLIGLNFVEILKFFKGDNEQETSVLSAANELSGGFGQLLLEKIELGKMDDELNSFKAEMNQKYSVDSHSDCNTSATNEKQPAAETTDSEASEIDGAQEDALVQSSDESSPNEANEVSDIEHIQARRATDSTSVKMPVVESRAQALANLSSAMAYFKVREPASPVSDLLTRAVAVADSDFMSALANLTGESTDD